MFQIMYRIVVALFFVSLAYAVEKRAKRSDYSIPTYGPQHPQQQQFFPAQNSIGHPGHPGHHPGHSGQPFAGPFPFEQFYQQDGDLQTEPSSNYPSFRTIMTTMGLIMAPLIGIAGISAMMPAISAGKRKRAFDQLDDMVNRVHNIYLAVTESEECMDRVICELGGVMKNVSHKQTVFGLLSTFIPGNYKKYVKTLKDSAFSGDIRKCEKIKCNIIDDDSY